MRVVEPNGKWKVENGKWGGREMDCWKWFWTGVGLGLLAGWIAGTAFGLWFTTEGTETRFRGARKDDSEMNTLRAVHQQLAHPIHEITPSRCAHARALAGGFAVPTAPALRFARRIPAPQNDRSSAPLIHRQRTLLRHQSKICCRRAPILGGWDVRSGGTVVGAQTVGVEFRMGVSAPSVVMIEGGVA